MKALLVLKMANQVLNLSRATVPASQRKAKTERVEMNSGL